MKKSLFLAMAAVALLSGCSKDDGGITIDNGNGNEGGSVTVDPDAVMVQLGARGITSETTPQTRASIDEWNDTPVGIYGVAKAGVTAWAEADNSLILNNAAGTIAKDATAIVFANNMKYYYPMQNSYFYSFYGYSPYSGTGAADTNAPTNNGSKITKEFTMDGTQDILWGMAVTDPQPSKITGETGTTYDGYNAKFFRKTAAGTPSLTFKHALTRLKFAIVQGDGYDTAQDLKVTGISITNAPTTAVLTIADLANLTPTTPQLVSGADKTAEYSLKDVSGNAITSVSVNNAGTTSAAATEIGESIMLPADAVDAEGYYTAKISLTAAPGIFTGGTYTSNVKFKLNTGVFEAGKSYKINLTVYSLSEIKLEATLTPWDTATPDTDIEIN